MIDKMTSFLSRLFFTVGLLLLLVAIADWILRIFGWTFSWLMYQPGRLFEFSAILFIAVIVMLLRQIREGVKSR